MSAPENRAGGSDPAGEASTSQRFAVSMTDAQSALYSYICNLLGSARDARDVLQETNLVLLRKANQYDFERPFLAWAYRIAHFQVLSHRKKHATERLLFSDRVLEKVATEAKAFNDTINDRMVALEECVSKLPSAQRAIVLEHYLEGQSVKSIAAHHGKSENAVSAVLYRARKSLIGCVQRTVAQEASP